MFALEFQRKTRREDVLRRSHGGRVARAGRGGWISEGTGRCSMDSSLYSERVVVLTTSGQWPALTRLREWKGVDCRQNRPTVVIAWIVRYEWATLHEALGGKSTAEAPRKVMREDAKGKLPQ